MGARVKSAKLPQPARLVCDETDALAYETGKSGAESGHAHTRVSGEINRTLRTTPDTRSYRRPGSVPCQASDGGALRCSAANRGRVASEAAHDTFSESQISRSGGNADGSSSVAVVSSIAVGSSTWWYAMDVPHWRQKLRVTGEDDWNVESTPRTSANRLTSTTNHATDGAPLARRQLRQ